MTSEATTTVTSETIETLLNRVTVRDYTDAPVSDEIVMQILRAAQRSPTSSNMQTYSLVVVRDQAMKKQLNDLVIGGQKHIETLPGVYRVVCGYFAGDESLSDAR